MSSKVEQSGRGSEREGRDAAGRFVVGNPGGPGNPYARRVGELKKLLLETVVLQDLAEILAAMIKKAKEGNVQAAKLVLQYVLGKPAASADPDRVDGHEWAVQRDSAAMYDEMADVTKTPPANITLGATRVLRPLIGSIVKEQMADVLLHPEKHFEEFGEEGPEEEATAEAEGAAEEKAESKRSFSGVRPAGLEDSASGLVAGDEELAALWELLQKGHGRNGKQTEKTGA
jgi:hypothetical protein